MTPTSSEKPQIIGKIRLDGAALPPTVNVHIRLETDKGQCIARIKQRSITTNYDPGTDFRLPFPPQSRQLFLIITSFGLTHYFPEKPIPIKNGGVGQDVGVIKLVEKQVAALLKWTHDVAIASIERARSFSLHYISES